MTNLCNIYEFYIRMGGNEMEESTGGRIKKSQVFVKFVENERRYDRNRVLKNEKYGSI